MTNNHAEILQIFDPYPVEAIAQVPAINNIVAASASVVSASNFSSAPGSRSNSPALTVRFSDPSGNDSQHDVLGPDTNFFNFHRHSKPIRSRDDETVRDPSANSRSLTFCDVPVDGSFFLKISIKVMCLPDQPTFELTESVQITVSDLVCSVLNTLDESYNSGILSTAVCFELHCAKTNECLSGNGKLIEYRVFSDALRFSMDTVKLLLIVGKAVPEGHMFQFQQKNDLTCQRNLERSLKSLDEQLKLIVNPWRLQAANSNSRVVFQNTVSILREVEAVLNLQHSTLFRRIISIYEKMAASVLQSRNLQDVCLKTAKVVSELVNSYANAFDVPFQVRPSLVGSVSYSERASLAARLNGRFSLALSSLHRYSQPDNAPAKPLLVECSVCDMEGNILSEPSMVSYTFEHKLKCSQPTFYTYVSNEDELPLPLVGLNNLTPTARLMFRLYAVSPVENGNRSYSTPDRYAQVPGSSTNGAPGSFQQRKTLVGWSNIPLFDNDGCLKSGTRVIPLWPGDMFTSSIDKDVCSCINMNDSTCLMLVAAFHTDHPVYIHQATDLVCTAEPEDIANLPAIPPSVEERLFKTLYVDLESMTEDDRSFFWSNRQLLKGEPRALPIIIASAPRISPPIFNELVNFVTDWPLLPGDPLSILRLLLPSLTNPIVTEVLSLVLSRRICSDSVIDLCLPQFVQSLRRHGWRLADALIKRTSQNHELSVTFYWLLAYEANNCEFVCCRSFYSALSLYLRSRMTGTAFVEEITNQHFAVMAVMAMAEKIYNIKNSAKQVDLQRELRSHITNQAKNELPAVFTFPCVGGADTRLGGLEASDCAVLSSRAAPLRLKFKPYEYVDASSAPLMCIVKVGDDLRNDLVALQLVRIMDYIWMSSQLDLRVITYKVLPTDVKQGIIEFVQDVDQLRVAQGDLSKNSLIEWFTSRGADKQLDPGIVDTFTRTCAAWCVASYIIGVGDRHNDNILLHRTTGHLFHIDFGRLFGDAEKIAGMRRDRVPFVFTDAMAAVIAGGHELGQDFAHHGYRQFVETCCLAFNLIRRRGESMLLSAVKSLRFSPANVKYLQDCLLLHLSDSEANTAFEKMITESVKSVAPKFNFFIHSIAQKFVQQPPALPSVSTQAKTVPGFDALSVPNESIVFAEVTAFYKVRDPVKHYMYQIGVYPELASHLTLTAGGGPLIIFRRFSEVNDLRETLVNEFALLAQQFAPFKTKNYTENRDTAKKRTQEINAFFQVLFSLAVEVRRSTAVGKFFKVRPRDLQSAAGFLPTNQATSQLIKGQLWMTVTIRNPESPVLEVLVHRGLNLFYETRSDGEGVSGRARVTLLVKDQGRTSTPTAGSLFSINEINNGVSKFRTDIAPPGSQPLFNKLFVWRLPSDMQAWPSDLSLFVKVKVHQTNACLSTLSTSIPVSSSSTVDLDRVSNNNVKLIGSTRIALTKMISWATAWPVIDSQYFKLE